MYNAPIFMHSKQGKKRPFHTISTHFNTNLTTDPQKQKKYTIHKTLMFKHLPKCVLKSLNFFVKIFGGYKKKL